MATLSILAALGASLSWALGALLAHKPAKLLGAFGFTRIQLVSAAALLILAVSLRGGWSSVAWSHWPGLLTSSVVGVVVANLAMAACLRRGGPRRTLLLQTISIPLAAGLGWLLFDEAISMQEFAGIAVIAAGIAVAILYRTAAGAQDEVLDGSLLAVVALGLVSAFAQAVGLLAMKPVLLAGTDPLAASALRTGGAALLVTLISLWPAKVFQPASERTATVVISAIVPGVLGYVIAVSLLLSALSGSNTGITAALGSTAPVIMLPVLWISTKRPPPRIAWMGAALVMAGTGLMAMQQ
jgi:drug/metabolite transporter (DMT)-like permease